MNPEFRFMVFATSENLFLFSDHPDVYTASASASIAAPPPSSEEALWRNAAAVADASAAVGEAVSHFNCY